MKVIVCVDDQNGMLFNQRRQSRDQLMLRDMIEMVRDAEEKLWISHLAEKMIFQFLEKESITEQVRPFITVTDGLLEEAEEGEFCFVEAEKLSSCTKQIETMIVYRWNRLYPADQFLDIDLSAWRLEERKEFAGSSHEIITREVYTK